MKRLQPKRLFILTLLLVAFILMGLILANVYVFVTTPVCDDEYMAATLDKQQLLRDTRSPRLVFVGDSHLTFSLNSQLMDETFDYTPVNLGTIAHLGLKFDLDSILHELNAGDVVVISPTFPQFTGNASYFFGSDNYDALWMLVRLDMGQLRYMTNPEQIRQILVSNMNLLGKRFQQGGWLRPSCVGYKLHSRSGFGAYGDYVAHLNEPSKGRQYEDADLDKSTVAEHVIVELNQIASELEQRDIRMFFAYPSYVSSIYTNSRDNLEAIDMTLKDRLTFPVLGEIQSYALDPELLYDSIFHATAEGRTYYTQQLIEDLSPYLTDSE